MIKCRLLVFLVFFSCIGGAVSAQSVKELQKKKSGILNELSVTQDLIKKSEKDKEVSLRDSHTISPL